MVFAWPFISYCAKAKSEANNGHFFKNLSGSKTFFRQAGIIPDRNAWACLQQAVLSSGFEVLSLLN